MTCPRCGHTMNHHANKLVMEGLDIADEGGDVGVEAFSCPHCGFNAARDSGQET